MINTLTLALYVKQQHNFAWTLASLSKLAFPPPHCNRNVPFLPRLCGSKMSSFLTRGDSRTTTESLQQKGSSAFCSCPPSQKQRQFPKWGLSTRRAFESYVSRVSFNSKDQEGTLGGMCGRLAVSNMTKHYWLSPVNNERDRE